jgi:hypothetical protein
VSAQRLSTQIDQLGLNFNANVTNQLAHVATCNRIDGVVIDENELSSLADMIKEASGKQAVQPSVKSSISDANPITRQSLSALAGDENDLLSESPVFSKANQH